MPVKVLDTIKEKIKNNYDKLYDDYDTNKKTILKNIQQTENNRAGEDALKSKFDNVIKEKQHYDKLKDEFDRNQRKLKKVTCFLMVDDRLKKSDEIKFLKFIIVIKHS